MKALRKAKGANKNVAESIRHEENITVLFDMGFVRHKMKRIQCIFLRIGIYYVIGIYDDKRYILDDGAGSLVYFQRSVFG